MANNKIRVAITQGDPNGIGYELIMKAFAEPEILELCTPIIYGSPKMANYQKDALQIQCQFSIIKDAREARDGRVNLLPCCKDIKVEFGKSSAEANAVAEQALEKAQADISEGLCDVLVCAPMENQSKDSNVLPIHVNEVARVCIINNVEGSLTQENIIAQAKILHKSIKRDFRLSNPRIAILSVNAEPATEEQDIIAPAVSTLAESGIQAFGPYTAADFFEARKHEAFDGIIAMTDEQINQVRELTDAECIVVLANSNLVCTMPDCDARFDIAGKNVADGTVLRNAIYTATDIFRHREEYDEPMANPLPKLYHERPDNGEKLRFSIPKKKEEA